MNVSEIKDHLQSDDPQNRMRGLTALREYDPEVAVPLLTHLMADPEVLVRSFVAMGLGRKRSEAGFAALVTMLGDGDANIRAEAASSLSLYGPAAVPHLRRLFQEDSGWLSRHGIIAAMMEMSQSEVLLELCQQGLSDRNLLVRETALDGLGTLANTLESDRALELLLAQVDNPQWQLRARVAYALRHFQDSRAVAALEQLRQDPDHRVVATLLDAAL
ncbi:HEAT repeat domain-containing protein [Sodalinema gerasimenkoae]|uniref:HEAT repeat domain-containing protein n=1 Tax=Sodalinema gerasimenkoae TaxID=2862348 RepID=UPI00135BB7AD|nr:HEAT repeat domain-containing protein [Sodalinema gerasimenkoae]